MSGEHRFSPLPSDNLVEDRAMDDDLDGMILGRRGFPVRSTMIGAGDRLQSDNFDSGNLSGFNSADLSSDNMFSPTPPHAPHTQLSGVDVDTDNLTQDFDRCVSMDDYTSMTADSGFASGLQCSDYESGLGPAHSGALRSTDEDARKTRRAEIAEVYFSQDEDGDTQLHLAIVQEDDQMAIQLVTEAPYLDLLDLHNDLGQTPLHLATMMNKPMVIQCLRARGVALDTRDRYGNTPLHVACARGFVYCIQALYEPVPPHIAQHFSQNNMVVPPLNPLLYNYNGDTCLHVAAANNHLPCIQYLTSNVKVNINLKDARSGRTVLHHAVETQNLRLCEFLLKQCNADVHAQTFNGQMPLELAAGREFQQIMRLLIDCGADRAVIDFPDDSDSEVDYAELEEETNFRVPIAAS